MKVTCQNCNATYAINDAAIPPKGARAQCPRCKHLQAVKRAEADAPPLEGPPPLPADPFAGLGSAPPPPLPKAAAPGPTSDPFAGLGAAPPPPLPRAAATAADPFAGLGAPAPRSADPLAGLGAPAAAPRPSSPTQPLVDPFSSLGFGKAPAPAPAPVAAPAAGADPFADLGLGGPPPPAKPVNGARPQPAADPFAGIGLAPSAPAVNVPPRAAAPSADPFADLDLGPRAAPAPAPLPAAAAPAASAILGKCATCGKALTDPFDAALGSCESCRAKETPLQAAPAGAPVKAASAPAIEAPPMPENRAPAITGSRPLQVEHGQPKSVPTARVPSVFRPPPKRNPVPVAVGVAVALGLGLFGAWKLHLIGGSGRTQAGVPPELRSRLGAWSMAFPDREGTPADHLESARQHMFLDRPGDYRIAEAEYEKAATLAGDDHGKLASAVAGVVQAYLLGRGESRDTEMESSLMPMADAAQAMAPTQHDVLRAKAYALAHQSSGQLDEARQLAQQALAVSPPEGKAEALLCLGALFIDSAQQSLDFLNRAIQADPKLQRAYFLRGLAAAKTGHYRQALADFEDRVKRDPTARNAALEIARVHLAIGDPPGARDALKKLKAQDPHAVEAQLGLAIIDYQVDRKLGTAEAELGTLLADIADDGPLPPIKVRALVHGSALARENGDMGKARTRIERALQAQPDFAPALYQRVVLALAEKRPAEAHPSIDKLLNMQSGNSLDGVRVDALAGRVAFAENKPEEGVSHFRAALQASSIDLRAAILGGALAAKSNRSNEAYELMKKAVDIDPGVEQRHRGVTEYYESEKSELAAAAGGFEDDQTSGLPIAYAGVIEYHRGDLARAERSFAGALKIEPDTSTALAYEAQIQLDRENGSAKKAKDLADKALASDRSSVLAMYTDGRAREALKDPEGARENYRDTLRQAPGFTSAMYRMALLDQADNRAQPAEELLVKVVFADGEDTLARRLLFDLGY